jgi:protein-disulfide isomerase
MREIWFSLLIVLSLAGASPAFAQTSLKPASGGGETLAVKPDDRVLGKADAPITIIEYASLTCPHCAHFTVDVLPKLQQKWIDTGKAKLVLRDFPLDEPALRAAMVARCAPPDKF